MSVGRLLWIWIWSNTSFFLWANIQLKIALASQMWNFRSKNGWVTEMFWKFGWTNDSFSNVSRLNICSISWLKLMSMLKGVLNSSSLQQTQKRNGHFAMISQILEFMTKILWLEKRFQLQNSKILSFHFKTWSLKN